MTILIKCKWYKIKKKIYLRSQITIDGNGTIEIKSGICPASIAFNKRMGILLLAFMPEENIYKNNVCSDMLYVRYGQLMRLSKKKLKNFEVRYWRIILEIKCIDVPPNK